MRGVFGSVKIACSMVNGKEVFLLTNMLYLHTHLKMQAKLAGSYNTLEEWTQALITRTWERIPDVFFVEKDF